MRPVAKASLLALAIVALLGAAAVLMIRTMRRTIAPDPTTIVSTSLQSMREQNRLVPFQARYVSVVTASQKRLLGLSSVQRTLIMPGTVRYEVNLAALTARGLAWDAASRTLAVTLPPIEVAGPEIDLAGMRSYDAGGVLLRLTDAAQVLDTAARTAGQADLLAQARGPVPMRLARDAARRAVEQSFALPLRAAGLDATVRVRFGDEADFEAVDRSRALRDVYANSAG